MSSPSPNDFTLEDFKRMMLKQLYPGVMEHLLRVLSGEREPMRVTVLRLNASRELHRRIGIIDAMTVQERLQPKLIHSSREKRIAAGAGVSSPDVRDLIKLFNASKPRMMELTPPQGFFARLRWLRDSWS